MTSPVINPFLFHFIGFQFRKDAWILLGNCMEWTKIPILKRLIPSQTHRYCLVLNWILQDSTIRLHSVEGQTVMLLRSTKWKSPSFTWRLQMRIYNVICLLLLMSPKHPRKASITNKRQPLIYDYSLTTSQHSYPVISEAML